MANAGNDPQYLDMDPVQPVGDDVRDAIADTVKRYIVPLNSRAVMPDGRVLSREQILAALNLNPGTPPDAWLAIIGCGSNASALNFREAREIAARNVIRAASTLEALERLGARGAARDEGTPGGFAPGGTAPGAGATQPGGR